MMQASAFEYRHRYLVHGLIYGLCFAAPWTLLLPVPYRAPMWDFVQNGSIWFQIANSLSKPLYQSFAFDWNAVLVVMILFAVAGAALRTWGAAYLGATTVQRGGMVGDRIVADGPYRFVRNPLYLGTVLHTIAVSLVMRPEAGVLCLALITLLQFRLIFREEGYLLERSGAPYAEYLAKVPRFIPSIRPRIARGSSHPLWTQGVLSEVYAIGAALTFAAVGWSRGFGWENSVLRVMQGIVISLGISVVARAFIPKAGY